MVLYSLVIKSPFIFAANLRGKIITTKEYHGYFIQFWRKFE